MSRSTPSSTNAIDFSSKRPSAGKKTRSLRGNRCCRRSLPWMAVWLPAIPSIQREKTSLQSFRKRGRLRKPDERQSAQAATIVSLGFYGWGLTLVAFPCGCKGYCRPKRVAAWGVGPKASDPTPEPRTAEARNLDDHPKYQKPEQHERGIIGVVPIEGKRCPEITSFVWTRKLRKFSDEGHYLEAGEPLERQYGYHLTGVAAFSFLQDLHGNLTKDHIVIRRESTWVHR